MPRRATVVLCDGTGALLGQLPAFTLDAPWWPEAGDVVEGVADRFGVALVVLRLLATSTDSSEMGGEVTYLAEVVGAPPRGLEPVEAVVAARAVETSALRAPWARPGGVAETVTWADAALRDAGRPRVGPARQVKSWNLSSVLRLSTTAGDVWCKSVPPFMAHEGTVITDVAAEEPDLVPPLVAADRERATVLLGHVPGEDQWTAPPHLLAAMVRRLVALQARWADRVPQLLAAGLWDVRAQTLPRLLRELLARASVRDRLTVEELAVLDRFAVDLPDHLAALAACGLPETLVRGDFHPGNWRSDGTTLTLLDWGDSAVGHPLLDLGFLGRVPEESVDEVRGAWLDACRSVWPGCHPVRAAELVAPLAPVVGALTYQRFLDHIEPSEHVYHVDDVPRGLQAAAGLL